jgi:hypothetical protein
VLNNAIHYNCTGRTVHIGHTEFGEPATITAHLDPGGGLELTVRFCVVP